MSSLHESIDDNSKIIEAEVQKVVPPEKHSKYIWGNYINKQLGDYNLLFVKTLEEDPTLSHWVRGIVNKLPFGSVKEQFVILTEDDNFNKGYRAVFKVRPSWFCPTNGQYRTRHFTILEKVVKDLA